MLTYIKYELIRSFRSSSTKFLAFILLCFLIIVSMQYLSHKQDYEQIEVRMVTSAIKWQEQYKNLLDSRLTSNRISQGMYEEAIATHDAMIVVYQDARNAATEENWKEYHKNMVIASCMEARSLEKEGISESIREAYLHNQEDIENYEEIFAIPKLNYANVSSSHMIAEYQKHIFLANYHYQLYELDLPTNYQYSVDSGTIFHIFMNEMSPLFLVLFIVLLHMDQIAKDREVGIQKSLLSNTLTRFQYSSMKIASSTIITLVIIFFILLIATLCLGIQDQFLPMQYPAITNTQGFTSFAVIPADLAEHVRTMDTARFFGNIQINPVPAGSISPYYKLAYLPIWQFNLLCIPLFSLFVFFCVSLQTLCSILIKNKYIALLITISIVLIGQLLAPVEATGIAAMLNPFMYRNPVYIVSGLIPYSYLMGMLVLSIYSIMLVIITTRIFKRKDIG